MIGGNGGHRAGFNHQNRRRYWLYRYSGVIPKINILFYILFCRGAPIMFSYETILFTQEGHTAVLTLNRPERRNAFTHQMLRELADAVQRCATDETIRAVLI
ncbi:MAG: enoyl-CoA hydratase/isomerase family protein, partial [Caldilineaceae bacterium]|nr:enoyl-CoA hydratase/isomerase family protein [Caldilineaceae bacterium]